MSEVEVPERVAPATVDCNGIKVGIDGSTSTTIWPDGGTGPDALPPQRHRPAGRLPARAMKFPPTPYGRERPGPLRRPGPRSGSGASYSLAAASASTIPLP